MSVDLLTPGWHLLKCSLASFYSAMDTNETAASQSNTGMFGSMLPRLRHVVLVYSMRIRKGTQGQDACRLKKPDLPGFILIFYIGTKTWHALFCSSRLQFVIFFARELFRLLPFQHHSTVGSWVMNNVYVVRKTKGLRPECERGDIAIWRYRYNTVGNSAMARTPLYAVFF